jgi:prepilin-type N-terminal cleavage/methylation domain-containing protein
MRAKRFGLVWLRRKKGFSIIEVITAVAILGIGIWAIVALFPTGQNIIRRSGLRQMATQLAHEAISDFLADPAKMPFAIVPFNPADPQIANRPVLLEPADLLTVRYTYNFVWGEPLDDGLPPGDPNKRVGLVQVGNQWRAILRFAPAAVYRVYREVRYRRVDNPPSSEFEFSVSFDPVTKQIRQIRLYMHVNRPNGVRIFRVTYPSNANPLVPVIVRELYLVPTAQGQFDLRAPAIGQPEVVEEYPIDPASFVFANGVLTFNNPMPGPSSGITPNQLGFLRVDYFVGDPTNPQSSDRWWIVETGTTFDPDPTLKAQGVSSVFQTTFGGMTNFQTVYLMPNKDDDGDGRFDEDLPDGSNNDGDDKVDEDPKWGDVLAPIRSDLQSGLFSFILPVGTSLRVAYRAGDDLNTPVDESWFLQVIKPPDDFQFQPDPNASPPPGFEFERLRWFTANGFNSLLAGLNVQVRYRSATNELFTEVVSISGDGSAKLSQVPSKIEEVRGASLLVRVSGGSMWRQSPPKTRADYVELATIVPPPAKLTQP